MTQRKLSKLWSSIFAVMMLLVGSTVANAQVNSYDAGGTLIQSFASCTLQLQDAINATPLNGEVRILAASCNPGLGGATINISNNIKLTSGVGGTTLELGNGDVLNINSGTVTLGTGVNNIDIQIGGNGTTALNIAAGASLVINGAGNTIGMTGTSQLNNNGSIVTTLSPRGANAAEILGTNVFNTNNAAAGVYVQSTNATLSGAGTWGNLFFLANYTANGVFNIADDAEVVVQNGDTFTLGSATTFAGTTGGFDVHFQDASVLAGNFALTIRGNLYAANNYAAATTSLTVGGSATFMAAADYTAFFTTSTFEGDLSVENSAGSTFAGIAGSTVNAWANVNSADANFSPMLVFPNLGIATQSLVSAGALTTLDIATGETVNAATAITVTGAINNSGTYNQTASSLTANSTTSNNGTIATSGTGAATFVGNVTNNNIIEHGANATTMAFNAQLTNTAAGDITRNIGSGLIDINDLSNAGTLTNTASGSIEVDDVLSNTGTISNTGGGSVLLDDSFTNNGLITSTGSNGSVMIDGNVNNANNGTLTRTAGTFTIDGDLTNNGAITNSSATFGGGSYATRLANAQVDGIVVTDDFVNNNPYTGNVIMSAPAGNRNVSATAPLGSLTVRSVATNVVATTNLTISNSLILAAGTFNLAANTVTLNNNTVNAADTFPAHGIIMGPNTQWTNGEVRANTTAPNGLGFYQAAAGVPAGSFYVDAGQVQLLSNVNVSNITVAGGATVRTQFQAFCYELIVAGTSTINGAILACNTFTITDATAGSIRAQLQAAGYDPDNVNVSVQIAIGNSNMGNPNFIALTDQGAEGTANTSNWKGVTIVDTQRRFILTSGTVVLNDANLTLRGGFVYDGNWNDANTANRTRLIAGSFTSLNNEPTGANFSETFSNNNGGWLKFTGLNVPNANFVFIADGVNNDADDANNGFQIRRVSFERTGNSPIALVDNNNINAGNQPSTLIVSEKLYISGSFSAGDNNIKYVGGNNRAYSGSLPLGNPRHRSIQIATNALTGSGYFWLANDYIDANDPNNIAVLGESATSHTDLQMQFLKSGDAGRRDIPGATPDVLDGIGTIGNGGMSYVRAGWLVTNDLNEVDGDFTLGADRNDGFGFPVLELTEGVNFTQNLFVIDNNAAQRMGTGAQLRLMAQTGQGAVDQETVVNGIFQTGAYNSANYAGYIATGAAAGRTHNLVLKGTIIFGASNEGDAAHATTLGFINPRPSRIVFAGSANQTFSVGGNVTSVRIPRPDIHMTGAASLQYNIPATLTILANDLLLHNGVLLTNGNLGMYTLGTNSFLADGAGAAQQDPDFTSTPATHNLSIVTRSRNTDSHGQLTRGLGSTGAYTSFDYNANGGAPYTVQHIGNASRNTGDEIPGLNLTNVSGNANNSTLNRLVIDLASSAVGIELNKDLIINNRVEMLTGLIDVATAAYLDIAPNVQWVHGHAVLENDFQTSLRFPNSAGNTAAGAGASARYDLWYVSNTNHTTGYEYVNGAGVRDLTVITSGSAGSPITVTLSGNKQASGSVRVVDGNLNLNSHTLQVTGNVIVDGSYNGNNYAGNPATNGVNNNSNARVTGWFPNRAGSENPSLFPYAYGIGTYDNGYGDINDTNGTIEFVGNNADSYVLGYVQANNKSVSLPNIVVSKTGTGKVIFEIDQAFTASPDEDINTFYVLSFRQNTGTTHLRPGATQVPATVPTETNQSDAPASGAHGNELTSNQGDIFAAGFEAERIQHWVVRQNADVLTGNFYSWGATMTVEGNYTQGDNVATTSAIFWGGQNPNGNKLWDSSDQCGANIACTQLEMQVNGNFTVLADLAADQANATNDNTNIHRFYLSNGWLGVAGDYSFFGHADITSGVGVPTSSRGFRGTIAFNRTVSFPETAALQSVRHVQSYRAYFEDVEIAGRGISLGGVDTDHMWVNDRGVVTFALGNVVTGPRELILQNTSIDSLRANEIISGAVRLSGSNSFVEGNLRRYMSRGGTTGGVVTDGYVFPLGQTFTAAGEPAFSGTNAATRRYRPLTLQFPANLGQTIYAVASTNVDANNTTINPTLKVQGRSGTTNNPGEMYTIDLTEASNIKWNVRFNQLPALEPNIRLGVQGLLGNQNSNIDDMRIVTPNTSGTGSNYRLAGVYDLTVGGPDDTFNPNDFIDGIPTFIQEGQNLFAQQYDPSVGMEFRIATNGLSNPFEGPGTVAYVQLIHNSPAGAVDVAINGTVIDALQGFSYQSATPYIALAADTPYNIEVKAAGTNTVLLALNGVTLAADKSYVLIAQGGADGKAFEVKVVENARRTATNASALEFLFSHGVTNGQTINVERVSTSTPRTLEQLIAVSLPYGAFNGYHSYNNPGIATLQMKSNSQVLQQYLFDFSAYQGQTLTLVATGAVGGTGANTLYIVGYDANGNKVVPQITTSNEDDVVSELPTDFVVYENYPNPFNPTTNLRFDLPEQANVRVEVVDLLGRQVMTIAPQAMNAGANKVITVDAARLASGRYFYRVVAEGATKTFVKGGMFTLLK